MPIKTKLTSMVPAVERLKTTVSLISGGYSIRDVCPDGKLTVYPWDAEVSEWIVESQATKRDDAGFSALVVQKLTRLDEVTVNRFVASELLLIMLVARSLVSDGTLTYSAVCPHCGAAQKRATIKVPGSLGIIGAKAPDYVGYDLVTLPCGDEVKLKPLLVRDVTFIGPDLVRKYELSTAALQTLKAVIEVGGGTPDTIDELVTYYKALNPADSTFLAAKLREISPALDVMVPHACDECKKPFRYNLGLHYDFFLPSLQ